jgi:cytoskeletal protein CcmA (bactofilin family)
VVHISGQAQGHLEASQKLEISSEGKYTGDIKSDTIRVAEGAQLKGTVNLEEEKSTISKPQDKKIETPPLEDNKKTIEPTMQPKEKMEVTGQKEEKKFTEKKEPTEEKELTEEKPPK